MVGAGKIAERKIRGLISEGPAITVARSPAAIVPIVLRDCAEKKVQNVIIISSGFGEVENHDLENEMKKFIHKIFDKTEHN